MKRAGLYSSVLLTGLSCVLPGAGCQPSSATNGAPDPASKTEGEKAAADTKPAADPKDATADELLAKMVAAYRKAERYGDSGKVLFRMKETGGSEPIEQKDIPLSVTVERPNKLRLHAFGAMVVSDGEHFRATAQDVPDQVLVRPAPEKLTTLDVTSDATLAQAVGGMIGVEIPQLRLLLAEKPLGDSAKGTAKRLKDELHSAVQCYRVEVSGENGKAVYWLDHRTYAVVRYEFPTAEIRKKIDPDGKLAGLEVIADFDGAQFNADLPDEAFAFEVPKTAKLVKFFLPPAPEPPSPLLGKKVDDFAFVDLDGKKVDRKSLEGKIVVMDVWATWCGWCFKGFPNLEKVYQKFKDNDKVAILAVNTDTPDVSDKQVRQSFEKDGLHIPIVRDTEKVTEKILKVEGLPTMYVLGPDGTLQLHEVGYKANLADVLPGQLERLLKGEDLAKEAVAKYEVQRDEYDKKVADALIGSTTVVELPQTNIAQKSEPSAFQVSPLWTAEGLKSPGNVLVVEKQGGSSTILVVDGWRMVAEVEPSGKVLTRHELDIPENAAVSFLRTAVDGDGKRSFVVFASGQQQLFLFDEAWKRLISYPNLEESGQHAGISDAQLADLDGDGKLELNVGYWGPVGVQNATLDGKKQWSNRTIENILRLGVVGPDDKQHRRLLAANGRDAIVPIDHRGAQQDPIRVANRAVHTVLTAELDGAAPQELCGLVATDIGVTTAIGLGLDGQGRASPADAEMWNYPLPNGVHNVPVETVVAGRLLGDGPAQWLLPGVDGSIHVLAADGKLIDHFNYGEAITGLAAAPLEGTPVLLVSTAKGLSAWKVSTAK